MSKTSIWPSLTSIPQCFNHSYFIPVPHQGWKYSASTVNVYLLHNYHWGLIASCCWKHLAALFLLIPTATTRTNSHPSQKEHIRLIKANRSLCTDLPPDTVVIMSFIRYMIDNQNEWLAQTTLSGRPIVFIPQKPRDITRSKIESSALSSGFHYLGTLCFLWGIGTFHVISCSDCQTIRCWKSLLSKQAYIGTIVTNDRPSRGLFCTLRWVLFFFISNVSSSQGILCENLFSQVLCWMCSAVTGNSEVQPCFQYILLFQDETKSDKILWQNFTWKPMVQ